MMECQKMEEQRCNGVWDAHSPVIPAPPEDDCPREPDQSPPPPAKRPKPDDGEQQRPTDADPTGRLSINDDPEGIIEIDRLLEEGMDKDSSRHATPTPSSNGVGLEHAKVSQKIVLRNRATDYFEVLPEGWIEVTHRSGMPVYLHKATRVCTFSRPYFIGPGSVRNHDVPVSAIPCLHQKKVKQWEADQKEAAEPSQPGVRFKVPEVKVQTIEDYKAHNIPPAELTDYAKSIFEFETIDVVRFQTWAEHRAFHKRAKREKQLQRMTDAIVSLDMVPPDAIAPDLVSDKSAAASNDADGDDEDVPCGSGVSIGRPRVPDNVKLITVPDMDRNSKPQKKHFLMNPQGKTSIAILHEYVQKILKGTVTYEFTETRNPVSPFTAVIKLTTSSEPNSQGADGVPCDSGCIVGTGTGNSKKNAKQEAAKQALKVLMPGVQFNEDDDDDHPGSNSDKQESAAELFDLIPVTDSRVPDLCIRTGQPTPFVILQECLKRNTGFGQTSVRLDIERVKHQQHAFSMTVGKHQVRVLCSNKKEGKQKASQAMLEKLHPQVQSWGALIRLYGYFAQRRFQKIRKEREDIIKLQTADRQSESKGGKTECRGPNKALLDKLKLEMRKLYERQNATTGPQPLWWNAISSGVAPLASCSSAQPMTSSLLLTSVDL